VRLVTASALGVVQPRSRLDEERGAAAEPLRRSNAGCEGIAQLIYVSTGRRHVVKSVLLCSLKVRNRSFLFELRKIFSRATAD
jgi:hypothetical protein